MSGTSYCLIQALLIDAESFFQGIMGREGLVPPSFNIADGIYGR